MCQLFALCANLPVTASLSIREFAHRGEHNPHGWGFAFSQPSKDGAWLLVKEPRSLALTEQARVPSEVSSPVILGHVRFASCGSHTHPNTHPFVSGRWAFAHNGTVRPIFTHLRYALRASRPGGETDSEHAFLWLLERLAGVPPEAFRAALADAAAELATLGHFNFILSDGATLYAHGQPGCRTLYYTVRRAPFQAVMLRDDRYSVDLAEIKDPRERVVLVATQPLTRGEKWVPIAGLQVFAGGRVLKAG